ncbi:MAG TPA: hypothetical protein VIN38_13195 [Thiobacillus sp.]
MQRTVQHPTTPHPTTPHPTTPLLNPLPPAGQEDRVEAVYREIQEKIGFVPDGLRLYGLSPALLESFVSNISYFNSGERLSPALMAMIRYVVSSDAQCNFCINMNEGFLTNMGLDLDAVRAARTDLNHAPFSAKEKILLKLAATSVSDPDSVNEHDIQEAKANGWSERDIFDVVAQATSNRAFTNVLRTFKVDTQGAFSA